MAKVGLISCVLVVFLVFYSGNLNANAAVCCNNNPSLGSCKPGVDDSPQANGKCWRLCTSGCTKGGFCKRVGRNGRHVCHCYC
uniref:Knottin scorpion toxin-like domain-containing protein n=1 Tax=Cucumis sativus TaxID=3659 RepID=A0A0A0LZ58_CUCSA